MRRTGLVPLALWMASCASLCPCASTAQGFLEHRGVITRVGSDSDIDIDFWHFAVTPETRIAEKVLDGGVQRSRLESFVGETVDVTTILSPKNHGWRIRTMYYVRKAAEPVKGTAIIEQVFPEDEDGVRVRADGHIVLVPKSAFTTRVKLPQGSLPQASATDLKPNVWIEYSGKQRGDGTVVVEVARLTENVVEASEAKLRQKYEFDPAQVTDADKQTYVGRKTLGVNVKKLPATKDQALQARIERIGQSLVPKYQLALAEDDPTKIHFRFQVVDDKRTDEVYALPSGIVLVPTHLVAKVEDDAQVAALIAFGIATAIEKRDLRVRGTQHVIFGLGAAEVAAETSAYIATYFVPFTLPEAIALSSSGTVLGFALRDVKELPLFSIFQADRVSLGLLHDAGFDVTKALDARHRLNTDKEKVFYISTGIEKMSERQKRLYQAVGDEWQRGDALLAYAPGPAKP